MRIFTALVLATLAAGPALAELGPDERNGIGKHNAFDIGDRGAPDAIHAIDPGSRAWNGR